MTLPDTTHIELDKNKMVATPRVARDTLALSASVPARYAVVMVKLIVRAPVVLLKRDTALPAENTPLGTSIAPLAPIVTYSPMSVIASVYSEVFSAPADGMFRTFPVPSRRLVMVALPPVKVVMLAEVELKPVIVAEVAAIVVIVDEVPVIVVIVAEVEFS